MDWGKLIFMIIAYFLIHNYIGYIWSKPLLKKKYKDYSYFEWFMLHKLGVDMRLE